MAAMRCTAAGVIRRARRRAYVAEELQRRTLALRALAHPSTTPDDAQRVARRYCRALGLFVPSLTGGTLRWLRGPRAAVLAIEAVDAELWRREGRSAAR